MITAKDSDNRKLSSMRQNYSRSFVVRLIKVTGGIPSSPMMNEPVSWPSLRLQSSSLKGPAKKFTWKVLPGPACNWGPSRGWLHWRDVLVSWCLSFSVSLWKSWLWNSKAPGTKKKKKRRLKERKLPLHVGSLSLNSCSWQQQPSNYQVYVVRLSCC